MNQDLLSLIKRRNSKVNEASTSENLYLLWLEPPFLNDNNTKSSRADLRPSYGNSLVERCFWKKEKPNRNPKDAYTSFLTPWICNHKHANATRVLGFLQGKFFFLKITVEAIPHHLELPSPLLFERYKKAP